jgi:predicted O-methyltransferase YrrM
MDSACPRFCRIRTLRWMAVRSTAHTRAAEMAPEELASLTELLRHRQFPGRHLEIGTAAGGTLCEMLRCFPADRTPPFVVVDTMRYFPDQLEIVRGNLRDHCLDPAAVDFRIATSDAAFQQAEAALESYDFMLIDGAHKIRYVMQDLRWTRLLAVGGRVCFHDYAPRCPGVVRAVDHFLAGHVNYRRETLAGSLLVLEKTAASATPEVGWTDLLWANLWSPWLQLQASLSKRLK